MKISLVIAAVDRPRALRRLLESLSVQTHANLEVVVVDQSGASVLEDEVAAYMSRLPLRHVRAERGLSRARNVGLRHTNGDVVAFPDDDCQYPGELLARVAEFFARGPEWDGLSGRTVDDLGRATGSVWSHRAGRVTRRNVWWRVASAALFLRRTVVDRVGDFDEQLGAGSGTAWGAGEELDYLLRALSAGFRVYYDPGVTVIHPEHRFRVDAAGLTRAYRYGAGVGRVVRKHDIPLGLAAYLLLRPGVGAVLALARGRTRQARYHWAGFRGRVAGWVG